MAKTQLNPKSDMAMSTFNKVLCSALFASALVAIIETEETYHPNYDGWFFCIEVIFGILFLFEYCVRVWIATDASGLNGAKERLKFILTPVAIIDLICIAPLFLGFMGGEVYLMKVIRVVRILRIIRIGRISSAFEDILAAIESRKYELLVSMIFAIFLMVISSTFLYLIEGDVQPEIFGSIPRSMWWSVATLTTVGYGDVYPITPIGRLFAGITAILGIGLIAMPTGIVAGAFNEVIQKRKNKKNSKKTWPAQE